MIEWHMSGECKTYDEVPNGAIVLRVGGRESMGTCEACGRPVLEGSAYNGYSDGIIEHKHCPVRRCIPSGDKE